MTTLQRISIARARLRQIPAPKKWLAYVLDAAYPVAEEHSPLYTQAVKQLLTLRPEFDLPLVQEVFFQFDRFRPEDVPLLQANATQWLPDIGLGYWAQREAPTLWTPEEFIESTQDELRPLMHRVFRIQQEKEAIASAWKVLLGTGVLVRIPVTKPQEFYDATMRYYQPQIMEPSLRSFPFYAPLLDGAALQKASGKDIQDWLCGATAYMRESSEDGGLLMLVPSSNQDWLEKLRAQGMKASIDWQIDALHAE